MSECVVSLTFIVRGSTDVSDEADRSLLFAELFSKPRRHLKHKDTRVRPFEQSVHESGYQLTFDKLQSSSITLKKRPKGSRSYKPFSTPTVV